MSLPIDKTNPELGWCSYFDNLSDYQKLFLAGAMIGAIEGLQNIEYTSEEIIDYFEMILFNEQTMEVRK